jgi:malonyl-CoA/methylmalonyl-CoA synthetase
LQVYAQLIEAYERMLSEGDIPGAAAARAGCKAIRLMVSGSAALPISVLEKWEGISGTVLLER